MHCLTQGQISLPRIQWQGSLLPLLRLLPLLPLLPGEKVVSNYEMNTGKAPCT